MMITDVIKYLDDNIENKLEGLPDEIFYFISRTTPLVNVDLLIKDEKNRILLAWRDDEYCGNGWHIPGGILRFKESFEQRIQKTAINELGVNVKYDLRPIKITETIIPQQENRAHFISFLYNCFLPSDFVPNNAEKSENDSGYLKWHVVCPDDLLKVQQCYREFMS